MTSNYRSNGKARHMVQQEQSRHITIRPNHRIAIFGRTGSGKTTLARTLLTSLNRKRIPWMVLDPKHDFRIGDREAKLNKFYNRKHDRQIIRAPIDGTEDEVYLSAIDDFFHRAGARVLYLDEVAEHTNPRILPVPLRRAIKMGRSKGLGVWSGTQRPKDIPSPIFTEAEHFIIFQLNYDEDRKKVVKFTGSKVGGALATLRGHDWVYYNVLDDSALKVEW